MVVSILQRKKEKEKGRRKGPGTASFFLFPFAFFLCGASGCTWDRWNLFTPPQPPPPPADSLVIRGDKLEAESAPAAGTAAADLAGAHELYRLGEYSKAERVFRKIADNTKNPPQIAEEARYYEAECMRRQERYPKAADTYNKMLTDFPSGAFREQAVEHIYEIADYWLEDTRKEMRETNEQREGKRWVVWPEFVHFEQSKPFLDEEGRAMEKLEQVRYNDMTGPLADKALFLAGSVKFFRGDYKEAEVYYTQLVDMHPNSQFVTQALELAIISKQLSTGGPAYDGRKVAEARRLVDTAFRNYPALASEKKDFLDRQLYSITMQQAAKDYEVAEFYRRTKHPCSAYFCYEVVRRRYPGTKYFDLATDRMHELRSKLEKSQKESELKVPPPADSGNAFTPAPGWDTGPAGSPTTPMPRQLPPGMLNGRPE